ncbi:hypothetical protein GS4_20_00600 [Gordonia soli NBRC 108243]|uniref:Uncharacterized protein n=2 Tax=Gordonia soli TaxID=320799 RepID=M0QK42_9ACTN|nr:hypothetical protein GS4_20_00600 [Gordonia soli NBRC 108243]
MLATMKPESAAADAQALMNAINAANDAAATLMYFGQDGMQGRAASASEERARQIARDIVNQTAIATEALSALGQGIATAGAAIAQAPFLQSLQDEIDNEPEKAPQAIQRASERMTSTYNPPMSAAAGSVPQPEQYATQEISSPMSGFGGDGGGGGSGPSNAAGRAQAGGVSDAGDYPGSGGTPTSVTPAAGPTSGRPNANLAGGSPDKPLSLGESPTSGRSGDGPGGLQRGGNANPAGNEQQFPGGVLPGAGTGQSSGAGGGGRAAGGGAGGVGGSPAGQTPLSRRLMGSLPNTPGTAGSSTPVGGPPTRSSGAGPAPHGGGARPRKGDDEQHKPASYLHTRDNGVEIVGSLPLVGPPVIGDWAPPAPAETAAESESTETQPVQSETPQVQRPTAD